MSAPEPSKSLPASLADAHELIHKLQTRLKELEFHRSAIECAKKNAVRKLNDELVKDGVCKLDVIDQTRLVQQVWMGFEGLDGSFCSFRLTIQPSFPLRPRSSQYFTMSRPQSLISCWQTPHRAFGCGRLWRRLKIIA